MGDEGTTLATRQLHTGVALRSTDDAIKLGSMLVKAGLAPKHIKNPADAVLIMLTGAELGLGPMASLRGMHCIEGKVTLSSEMMLSIVASHGVRFAWRKSDATCATIELKRDGWEPHVASFTLDEAKAAKLTGKDNWQKYPAAMLRARAASAACRAYCPDLLAGGGLYTPDEIEDVRTIEVSTRKPVEPATEAEVTQAIECLRRGGETDVAFARGVFSRASAEQQARITKAADEAKTAQSEAASEGSCGDGYEGHGSDIGQGGVE